MGRIFYIMGKSASGKDKIYNILMEKSMGLLPIVTYTTRPMRENEKQGVEYFFVDENKFKELHKNNKVIEYRTYNTVNGPWTYFTAIDDQIDLDKNNYLTIGTLESYMKMKKEFGKNIFPIYIDVNNKDRLLRAILREEKEKTPNYSEVCRRFLADEGDFSEENLAKAGIKRIFSNDNLIEDCVNEIEKYINSFIG